MSKYDPGYDAPLLARTYRYQPSTVEAIDKAAAALGSYPSRLTELLILDGLRRMESGELKIKRRPVVWSLHL